MRKIDIRARVYHLNKMIQLRRATYAQQADERAQLVAQCKQAGDHVPTFVQDSAGGIAEACEFCGLTLTTSAEQVSRNLVVTR